MFGDINKVEVMGNITRDLELRHTNSGTAVCSFSVATNRRYQQDNEWKEQTEFHNIVIWGQRAESFVERAKKGTRVYIEGRLSTRSWEDEAGVKHYRTEIVVLRIILIDRYERGEFNPENRNAPQTNDVPVASKPKAEAKAPKTSNEEKIDPDDLPF